MSVDLPELAPFHADWRVEAAFPLPRFEVFGPRVVDVYSALYGALVPFRIRTQDIRVLNSPNLLDAQIEIPLGNFETVIRLTPRQLEVQDIGRAGSPTFGALEVAAVCERALSGVLPTAQWGGVTFDQRLHVRPPAGVTPRGLIERFATKAPTSLGAVSGRGVSFFVAPPATERGLSAAMVVLEPSAMEADAIFCRIQLSWGPGLPSLEVARASSTDYLEKCYAELLGMSPPKVT